METEGKQATFHAVVKKNIRWIYRFLGAQGYCEDASGKGKWGGQEQADWVPGGGKLVVL